MQYANIVTSGLGESIDLGSFLGIIEPKLSGSTVRAIAKRAPALYAMLPDADYEQHLKAKFPWIVGSYAEFRDTYHVVVNHVFLSCCVVFCGLRCRGRDGAGDCDAGVSNGGACVAYHV